MSEKLPHGDLFVISAPSGAGKSTLCRRLLSGLDGIDFSISDTTRSPRAGEHDGVDYHFVDREVFDRRRKAGEFLEWAVVGGEMYGTAAESVRQGRARGRDVLLDIDTQGAESVRRTVPEAILIFILPPSREALRGQLKGRGTETPEGLTRRLGLARGEIEKAPMYDFVLVNDDLESSYDRLRAIVLAARCRRERQSERIDAIRAEFDVGRQAGE